MDQITKTKVKNGTITLPARVRKSWRNKEVVVVEEGNRLIVQPVDAEWDRYEKKLQKGKGSISSKIIEEAVGWARKHR